MEKALRIHLPGGQFEGVSAQRSRVMGAVRGKDNRTTERRLRLGLVRSSIKGWKIRPKGLVGNPDFFFPKHQLAIFVDGCFWHGCPKCGHIPRTNSSFWLAKISSNSERDLKHSVKLNQQGIRVLRFWEHELSHELQGCIEVIVRLLSSGASSNSPENNGQSR